MTLSRDLMLEFDSLGDNCEFGLVQRKAKAEPLGLFRFSYTPMGHLLKGLSNNFDGMDSADNIEVYVSPRIGSEFMVRQTRYDMVYHTGVREGQKSLEEVRTQEIGKLGFLRNRILEDLKEGEKIFVRKAERSIEKIAPLQKLLRKHGPNWLLWVVEAGDEAEEGTCKIIDEGLIQGYVDRFAPPDNAYRFSYDSWLRMCASAYKLWPKASTELVEEVNAFSWTAP